MAPGVQAGPGPQEVQEGEGEAVDPLQAQSLPAHRHPFFSEGEGVLYPPILPHVTLNNGQVQKLKDRQFGRVQLFVPHKNPPATIGTYH